MNEQTAVELLKMGIQLTEISLKTGNSNNRNVEGIFNSHVAQLKTAFHSVRTPLEQQSKLTNIVSHDG